MLDDRPPGAPLPLVITSQDRTDIVLALLAAQVRAVNIVLALLAAQVRAVRADVGAVWAQGTQGGEEGRSERGQA